MQNDSNIICSRCGASLPVSAISDAHAKAVRTIERLNQERRLHIAQINKLRERCGLTNDDVFWHFWG